MSRRPLVAATTGVVSRNRFHWAVFYVLLALALVFTSDGFAKLWGGPFVMPAIPVLAWQASLFIGVLLTISAGFFRWKVLNSYIPMRRWNPSILSPLLRRALLALAIGIVLTSLIQGQWRPEFWTHLAHPRDRVGILGAVAYLVWYGAWILSRRLSRHETADS